MRGLPIIFIFAAACTFGGRDDVPDPEPEPELCEDGSAPPCRLVEPPGPSDDLPETGVGRLAGYDLAGTDDGDRSVAKFDDPVNVLLLPDGDLLVADFNNSLLRRVGPTGEVSTLNETGTTGFNRPFGMVMMPDGTLYVQTDHNRTGDQGPDNGAMWEVTPAGDITLIANDTGRLRGLFPLEDGRLFFSDYLNHYVGIFDPASGAITTVAGQRGQSGFTDGTGGDAQFFTPYDIVKLDDDSFVVADFDNHCLRNVTLEGVVTTFAGTCGVDGDSDGPVATAQFFHPQAMARDDAGVIYFTDIDNYKIRKIEAGEVTTIAGTGEPGFKDGPALGAQFFGLEGLDVSPDGTFLYIADGDRGLGEPFHRIRRLPLNATGDDEAEADSDDDDSDEDDDSDMGDAGAGA